MDPGAIDKNITERNLTLPYQTVPVENSDLKLGIVLSSKPKMDNRLLTYPILFPRINP